MFKPSIKNVTARLNNQIEAILSRDADAISKAFNNEATTPYDAWMYGDEGAKEKGTVNLFGFLDYTARSKAAYGHNCPSLAAAFALDVVDDFAGLAESPITIGASDRLENGTITREELEAFRDVQLKCFFVKLQK